MSMAEKFSEILLTNIPEDDVSRIYEHFVNESSTWLKKARYEEPQAAKIVEIVIPYNKYGVFEIEALYGRESVSAYDKLNDNYERIIKFIPGEDLIVPMHQSSALRAFVEWSGGSFEGYPMDHNSIGYKLAMRLADNGFSVEFIFTRRTEYSDWDFSGLVAKFRWP